MPSGCFFPTLSTIKIMYTHIGFSHKCCIRSPSFLSSRTSSAPIVATVPPIEFSARNEPNNQSCRPRDTYCWEPMALHERRGLRFVDAGQRVTERHLSRED